MCLSCWITVPDRRPGLQRAHRGAFNQQSPRQFRRAQLARQSRFRAGLAVNRSPLKDTAVQFLRAKAGPVREHPRRPSAGFVRRRSEISGKRLGRLFAWRFAKPEHYFREHFVVNYCPLLFLEITGRNLPGHWQQLLLGIPNSSAQTGVEVGDNFGRQLSL